MQCDAWYLDISTSKGTAGQKTGMPQPDLRNIVEFRPTGIGANALQLTWPGHAYHAKPHEIEFGQLQLNLTV